MWFNLIDEGIIDGPPPPVCRPNQTSETGFLKPSESNFPTAGQLKEISDHSYYRVFWHLKGHVSHGVFWLACRGSW